MPVLKTGNSGARGSLMGRFLASFVSRVVIEQLGTAHIGQAGSSSNDRVKLASCLLVG